MFGNKQTNERTNPHVFFCIIDVSATYHFPELCPSHPFHVRSLSRPVLSFFQLKQPRKSNSELIGIFCPKALSQCSDVVLIAVTWGFPRISATPVLHPPLLTLDLTAAANLQHPSPPRSSAHTSRLALSFPLFADSRIIYLLFRQACPANEFFCYRHVFVPQRISRSLDCTEAVSRLSSVWR